MTEIEQLRADLATLEKAWNIADSLGCPNISLGIKTICTLAKKKIADLEAQQELIDPWIRAKEALFHWDANDKEPDYITKRSIFAYIQNLQAKVDELNHELRCERIDGGKVRDDLRAEIAELKAKTEREQLELCKECSHPLSDCGPLGVDGTPTADCKVCQLKAQIAEMEQHGRKVDQANHEHYGRMQDQIAIRDLKIEKLEGQLAGRPISEAAEELVKEMDEFKQRETLAEQEIRIRDAKLTVDFIVRNRPNGNPTACDIAHYARHLEDQLNVATNRNPRTVEQSREKLAELTTILNAIPPVCGLARELVERRIEGVKREIQNNG